MRKFLSIASFLSLLLLIGGGCDTSTSNIAMQTYENKDKGFSIQYPENWSKQEGAYGTTAAFLSSKPVGDNFAENITITAKSVNATLEAYVQSAINNAPKAYTDFKLLENTATKLGGESAKMLIYTFTESGYKLHTREFFVIKKGMLYDITFTSTQDNPSEQWEIAKKAIDSLKITQ